MAQQSVVALDSFLTETFAHALMAPTHRTLRGWRYFGVGAGFGSLAYLVPGLTAAQRIYPLFIFGIVGMAIDQTLIQKQCLIVSARAPNIPTRRSLNTDCAIGPFAYSHRNLVPPCHPCPSASRHAPDSQLAALRGNE